MTTTELFDSSPATFPELDTIVYLTGVSTELSREAHRTDLGLLVTPRSSVHRQIEHYELFGADNGLYTERHPTKGFVFDADAWLRWLAALPLNGALFACLPDVLDWYIDPETGDAIPFGNLEATIERSARYVDAVRDLGFPVAVVAQDGLASLEELPFDVDAVFLGGSDGYKLGPTAAGLIREAREAGKWTHVGRVNSFKRLDYSHAIGADSADGTFLRFGRKGENYPRLTGWLDTLATQARPTF